MENGTSRCTCCGLARNNCPRSVAKKRTKAVRSIRLATSAGMPPVVIKWWRKASKLASVIGLVRSTNWSNKCVAVPIAAAFPPPEVSVKNAGAPKSCSGGFGPKNWSALTSSIVSGSSKARLISETL